MNNESNTRVAESGRPKDVTGRIETEIRTYDLLDSLNIPYIRFDHEAAFTIDACNGADEVLGIHICKNLFLCNAQKTKFYLLLTIAMAILPTMILFFCMSRQIISGVTVGAVKE